MNEKETVDCPVENCSQKPLARGLFMHIYQTDDPPGEGHWPRYEVPPDLNVDEVKMTSKREAEADYPEIQDIDEIYYLDTYTGKAYRGKRGLMIHLGQRAGKDNIPDDVTDRHEADEFPIVDVDDNGNITEVIKPAEGTVPPLEPYLPWHEDSDMGYIRKETIRQFVEKVRNMEGGAVSPDYIEQELLE